MLLLSHSNQRSGHRTNRNVGPLSHLPGTQLPARTAWMPSLFVELGNIACPCCAGNIKMTTPIAFTTLLLSWSLMAFPQVRPAAASAGRTPPQLQQALLCLKLTRNCGAAGWPSLRYSPAAITRSI